MPQYYYIADCKTHSARCTTHLKEAKKMALEQKSLIYTNKNQLPEWVSEVGGFCDTTLRRANGKFAKEYSKKFFNEDIKNS